MILGLFKKKKRSEPEGKIVGAVTHYFGNCKAGIIKLKAPLGVGDTIHFFGHTTNFKQKITSMQINRKDVESATKPKEVGVVVNKRVRQYDAVYKL